MKIFNFRNDIDLRLKDFESAYTRSIKPLDDLFQYIGHELQRMGFEKAEDVLQGQFLISLYNLMEAAAFLDHKRDEIRKLISDQAQEGKA